jgi:hypothetical protein
MLSVVFVTLHKPPKRLKTSQQNLIFGESAKKMWSRCLTREIVEVFTPKISSPRMPTGRSNPWHLIWKLL